MSEATTTPVAAEDVILKVTGLETGDTVTLQEITAHIVSRLARLEHAVLANEEAADQATEEESKDE